MEQVEKRGPTTILLDITSMAKLTIKSEIVLHGKLNGEEIELIRS